jgi:hypothetical protein
MSPKAWSILILLQSAALAAWFFFISGFVTLAETCFYQKLLEGKPLPAITRFICTIHHFSTEPVAICLFLATSHWLVGSLLVCSPRRPDAALSRWLFFSTCSWGMIFVYSALLLCVLLMPFDTVLQTLNEMTPAMVAAWEKEKLLDRACLAGVVLYALAAMVIVYFRLRTRRPPQSEQS